MTIGQCVDRNFRLNLSKQTDFLSAEWSKLKLASLGQLFNIYIVQSSLKTNAAFFCYPTCFV